MLSGSSDEHDPARALPAPEARPDLAPCRASGGRGLVLEKLEASVGEHHAQILLDVRALTPEHLFEGNELLVLPDGADIGRVVDVATRLAREPAQLLPLPVRADARALVDTVIDAKAARNRFDETGCPEG